nr:hypothetical protein [Tanacetum cinerariifolium]
MSSMPLHLPNSIVISSPNHPTFDIEDDFSSNSLDYTPASPDYFPASPGNTSSYSSNNSYDLVPIASPTLSLFHDDPYIKVMHAYDTIMPPQVPIPPPIIVPPSPMLSLIFNSQEFFVPEEILLSKEQKALLDLSAGLNVRNQCFLVVTALKTARIEGKKPSELILSTQLRTVGMLETFPYVEDVDYITQDLAVLCVSGEGTWGSSEEVVEWGRDGEKWCCGEWREKRLEMNSGWFERGREEMILF